MPLVGAFSVITNLRMELFEALAASSQEGDLHSDISLIFNRRAGLCLPCLLRAAVCNYCGNEAAHDDTLPNVLH